MLNSKKGFRFRLFVEDALMVLTILGGLLGWVWLGTVIAQNW